MLIDAGHEAAEREIEKISRRLKIIYSKAAAELGKEWKEFLGKYEKKRKELYKKIVEATNKDDMAKARKAYNDFMRGHTLMDKRYRSLTENLAKEISHVNETAAEYVNGRTPTVYADNWNFSGKDIEYKTNTAIRFDIINPHTVENLVKSDANFLPRYNIDPAKDIPWNMEIINSEVAQGIVKGESIPKIAGRLSKICDINEKSAVRSARTIVTSVENKARMDTAHEAMEKGVNMRKMWIATHDNRVRDWHEQADRDYHSESKAIEIDEPFIVGGEELMYPADPSGRPENVYNCRCTTAHVVTGFTSILPPERRGKIRVTFG